MFKNRNWRQRRRGEGSLDVVRPGVAVSSLVWSVGRCPVTRTPAWGNFIQAKIKYNDGFSVVLFYDVRLNATLALLPPCDQFSSCQGGELAG